ncbi:MAG: DoxX family membrane protein [Gemmatimonadaceae bacterium]
MTASAHAAFSRTTSTSRWMLAAIFIGAGILHLLRPGMFVTMVPPWLPAPALLVMLSGVFEVMGGVGILVPLTRVVAGWGLIALLVAVLPANVHMLVQARAAGASLLWQLALLIRVPLQLVLIWWVHRATVRASA